jgi:hypothetical protein
MNPPNDCTDPVPHEYICKFCRKTGTAFYDRSCPPLRLEIWKTMLACDRCADYQTGYRRIAGAIRFVCETLIQICDSTKSDEIKNEAWKFAQRKIDGLTKAFAEHVCKFWHKPVQWEPGFTECILKKPADCVSTLSWYVRNVKA